MVKDLVTRSESCSSRRFMLVHLLCSPGFSYRSILFIALLPNWSLVQWASLESMCYRRFKKKENSALAFPWFCPQLKPPNDNCCFESNVGSEMRHPPACGGRADGRCVFFIIIVIISFCLFVCFRLFSFLFRSILYINIFQGVWCIMKKAWRSASSQAVCLYDVLWHSIFFFFFFPLSACLSQFPPLGVCCSWPVVLFFHRRLC